LLIILALAGGTAIGRKAKKPWIGSAIIGADCSVSFGIDQLSLMTRPFWRCGQQEFFGFTAGKGSRKYFGALLLGRVPCPRTSKKDKRFV